MHEQAERIVERGIQMKKAICIVLILTLLSTLAACGLRADAAGDKKASGTIVLLTDAGEIEDSATISSVWEGICTYGEVRESPYLHITADEPNQEARFRALSNAMKPEVHVVVCVGAAYENVVFEAQTAYPDVMFLLLDGEPHREHDAIYETTVNTHCILYQETQAGFLAGYAAVMDGNRKLGFCGESPEPAVIRYGYGFIQGADVAATQLGLRNGAVEIRYWYAGAQQETISEKMAQWYQNRTQVVFACDNGDPKLSKSVISAAEASEGSVIGADADRSSESQVVLCSAVKDYTNSVMNALTLLEENAWHWDANRAGQTRVLGIKEGAVGLSDAPSSWRFNQFTLTAYEELVALMKTDGILLDQGSSRELFPAVCVCSIVDEGVG
jgi:basic membrane protein A